MRIEKLEIRNFGKIKDLCLTFSEGMNVVFGYNESGKTSIQSFLKGMLYGLKGGRAAKDGSLPPLKRYKPWTGSEYTGFIEYRLDNGQFYRAGRNFACNAVTVHDGSFNDITNTFEVSREKGALFAEKHLGIGESCFERTAFIKQMESKIDEDGSKELINRLLNVSQTGFEDVSLLKAQEALKDTLKKYVGTDKTSTRPLDRIIERLEELMSLRSALLERRCSFFKLEKELGGELEAKNSLELRKSLISKAMKLFDLRRDIENNKKLKQELGDILDSVKTMEQEAIIVQSRIKEFNETKEQFIRFSHYSSEDMDSLMLAYHNLRNLKGENSRLRADVDGRKHLLSGLKNKSEELKAFQNLGDDAESRVVDLGKELERLKAEKEKNNLDVLNERIKAAKKSDRLMIYCMAAFLILAAVLASAGFVKPLAAYIGVPAAIIPVIALLLARTKTSKELSELVSAKNLSYVYASGITEEIERKQRDLAGIFRKAGVNGPEDFFRLKSEYDITIKSLHACEDELREKEEELEANAGNLAAIKAAIEEKLVSAGVLSLEAGEIDEEHIQEFKNGVRRLNGLEPSINYVNQRAEDLKKELEGHYRRMSSMCKKDFDSAGPVENHINALSASITSMEENLGNQLEILIRECSEKNMEIGGCEDIKNKFALMDINELESSITYNYNNICEELSNVLLKIREYETQLKSLYPDEDEILRIEGEIVMLEAKRNELEDTSVSLRTALDILTEASLEIQRDFAPALNSRMSSIIGLITGEKYRDLRADNRLNLKVISAESGDVVPVFALSGGTVDQIYLSLRLATADLIAAKGEKLPLIMDEVFAQYDDLRTRETLKFFSELSKQKQIILFTCKQREVDIARDIFGSGLNLIEI